MKDEDHLALWAPRTCPPSEAVARVRRASSRVLSSLIYRRECDTIPSPVSDRAPPTTALLRRERARKGDIRGDLPMIQVPPVSLSTP